MFLFKDKPVIPKKCPLCMGGRLFSIHTLSFTACYLCRGKGFLVSNYECACARPIERMSDDSIFFCGDKDCLAVLRADKKTEEFEQSYSRTTFNGRPWPGYEPDSWAE
jgi:hypothetical protein